MPARSALEAVTQSPRRFLRSSWPWRSFAYLLGSGVLAVPALGLYLLAHQVGGAAAYLALLAGAAVLALPLGMFEHARLRLIDRDLARRPAVVRARQPHAGWPPRLREPATWRTAALAGLLFATWWMDIGVLSAAVWTPLLLMSAPFQPGTDALTGLPLAFAGLVLLPLAAYPVTAWAGARATIVRAILAPREAEIIRSRARLVDAFEVERRRIERDLHDGAQQRLVSLTMNLGLALLDLPPRSAAAGQVRAAHEEAKMALAELRELIRGVHPQVLTDRGLPAAVAEAADRSPVPVTVDVALPGRLPEAVEIAAYYVVCESLANVAKHSGAARCSVLGHHRAETLVLEVRDDGRGGADPASGSGLAGLADRVAVVEGVMTLSSPPGGPTSVRVEIPCDVRA
ncbi:sensor histidine kinase [Sphaerisporangium rufum]|uniref:sensor histidine kinase n=1 Tax=Sphaerisporangium rufum TaxID=1381558 RepID=UPI001EF35AB8|nr:histidine kinase [Sphaerisporangium rufum]